MVGDIVKDAVGAQLSEFEAANQDHVKTQNDQLTKLLSQIASNTQPTAKTQDQLGLGIAMCARYVAMGKTMGMTAIAAAEADGNEIAVRALSAGSATAGGFLVPTVESRELIDLLRAMTVFRALQPETVIMGNGTLDMPKETGDPTAEYVGENANITSSQGTFGNVNLTWRKLAANVPLSNDLLRFSNPSADSVTRNALLNRFRVREDQAFIRDDGTQNKPKGLRYLATAANLLTADTAGSTDLDKINNDAKGLIVALANANVPMLRPGWIMAPRTREHIRFTKDTNGMMPYKDEIERGTWLGWPIGVTTSIPINLSGDGDESELYLADFSQIILGESDDIIINASEEAAYVDSGGTLISAWQRDQTVIRAIARHDLNAMHAEAIAIITNGTWGA